MKRIQILMPLVLLMVFGNFAGTGFAQEDSDKASLQERMQSVMRLVRNEEFDDALEEMEGVFEDHGDDDPGVSLTYLQLLQQVGLQRAQEERKSGNEMFYKSGKIARELHKKGTMPAQAQRLLSSCIYNEACTCAIDGKNDDALKYLALAFEAGFDDFKLAATDSDFGDLLKTEEYKKVLDDAKKAIAEKAKKALLDKVENFDSYDFDFEVDDVDGEKIKKSDFEGKVLIVDLWGTWRAPCRRQVPSLIKLKKKYKGKLEIVGFAYERTDEEEEALETVQDFMDDYEINYPCALGTSKIKKQVPRLRGYPTTLFIDSTGKVKMELAGLQKYEDLEAILLAVMKGEK